MNGTQVSGVIDGFESVTSIYRPVDSAVFYITDSSLGILTWNETHLSPLVSPVDSPSSQAIHVDSHGIIRVSSIRGIIMINGSMIDNILPYSECEYARSITYDEATGTAYFA